MTNQTIEKMAGMRLSAMGQEYRRQLELPAMNALSFDDRMALLVEAQWMARSNSRLKKLLKEANLRTPSACLEDLDYDPRRKLDRSQIAMLSDCSWIREARNLLVIGATGTGKTWLACAFANAACRIGMKVRCYRVNRLLTDLSIGRGDGSYNRLINELKKPDLLILDDFGMTALDTSGCYDLSEVIEERHGRKSTIVLSQLPVAQWHQVFDDSTIADAILDRLVNNSYRFELQGPSMRRSDFIAVPVDKKEVVDEIDMKRMTE
jgi:DNA replication protein DnaC